MIQNCAASFAKGTLTCALIAAFTLPVNATPRELLKFEAEGGGFEWVLKPVGKGTSVAVMRGAKRTVVYAAPGDCSLDNMFDAPLHPKAGLITPIVSCKAGARQSFIVASHSGAKRGLTFTHYRGAANCTDFTDCRVRLVKVLHRF
jgi:hypothetical protein